MNEGREYELYVLTAVCRWSGVYVLILEEAQCCMNVHSERLGRA